MLADAEYDEEDMHWRRNLAYYSTTFSGDGFVLVGDAAAFMDPFYSPGMDWISFTTSAAAELITAQRRGDPMPERITEHNRAFAVSHRSWFEALYKDKYEYMGEWDLMSLAFRLDLGLYYLGIVSQPFKYGERALLIPPFSVPPSRPVFALMRTYNRRLAQIARRRRRENALGKTNRGQRCLIPGFTLKGSDIFGVVGALATWLRLELAEGLAQLGGNGPSPKAAPRRLLLSRSVRPSSQYETPNIQHPIAETGRTRSLHWMLDVLSNPMDSLYDVAIIGGGPAGSTAATFLARLGRKVVVLEREKFPRFHIGESLLPQSMEAFERLGLIEKLDARFLPKYGAEITTACGTNSVKIFFKDGLFAKHDRAYQVTRSEFDKLLLDHAAENGAAVLEETSVENLEFAPEEVGLTIKRTPRARKASRRALSPARLQRARIEVVGHYFQLKRNYENLKKFSVFAHYENVGRDEGVTGSFIRIIRGTRQRLGFLDDPAHADKDEHRHRHGHRGFQRR